MKKKIGIIILICLICFGCSAKIEVPDLTNVEIEDAKIALQNINLIPSIEYTYDDSVSENNVVTTSPAFGEHVEENSKIILYVSKGPRVIYAETSQIEWDDTSSRRAEWSYLKPLIIEDKLYIECTPTFEYSFSWKTSNSGKGFGTASTTNDFKSEVPIEIDFEDENVKNGTQQDFVLIIPLDGLEESKPTNIYINLTTIVNGATEDLKVQFNIEW